MKLRFLALLTVLLLAACGGAIESEPSPPTASTTPAPSPDETGAPLAVQAWIEASDAGDCHRVKELVVDADAVDCDEVTSNAGLWSDDIGDLTTLDHELEEIADTSARVHTTRNGEEIGDWDLEWIDGGWLILLAADDA